MELQKSASRRDDHCFMVQNRLTASITRETVEICGSQCCTMRTFIKGDMLTATTGSAFLSW
ncbi:MAG TPA: hypothetical protein QF900_05750 [Arenicellales bacterium]|jgi:hypothetical protein|nr:hypothetical protein [Arenicellales bacterium]HJL66314.1 hypothetical protein [Arenicellales bacterium]